MSTLPSHTTTSPAPPKLVERSIGAGVLMGIGVAGFVDETVFHQILHWHLTKLVRPGEVDVLLPVRDLEHLLPLRGRLDARHLRVRSPGREAHR